MACNLVNNAAITNQLVAKSHVNVGKLGTGPNILATANKNYMRTIKMQLVIDDPKKSQNLGFGELGKFGKFGGKFVPESLITCLGKLEAEFNLVLNDSKFQVPKLTLSFFLFFISSSLLGTLN